LTSRGRRRLRAGALNALAVVSIACGSGGFGFAFGCGVDGPAASGPRFETDAPSEALATLTVRCDACAWEAEGREGVMLRVTLDERYVQHLPVTRQGRAEYRLMLGAVTPGSHTVRAEPDATLSSRGLPADAAVIESIAVDQVPLASPAHRPLSLAPFVYARPDTVGRFTDVPLFMWYEIEPSPRGVRYRYSVIFSNEDGGTPTDRLMATWGRTTDIEYFYSVEVDAAGTILDQDMQGPKHETLPFKGTREAQHPRLWVSTDNNMVLDRGDTQVRYGPEPVAFPIEHVSREAVMDAHPWLYEVMSRELAREGKIVPDAPPGYDQIPDPRRFVYLEGCGAAGDRAVAVAIGTGPAGAASLAWHASDRGVAEYRIVRDGCFRAATPLPEGLSIADVRAIRVMAYERPKRDPDSDGRAKPAARLTRINRLFMLDDRHVPGPSRLAWQGNVVLEPGAAPYEIPVP
jgi:hypothetical protein